MSHASAPFAPSWRVSGEILRNHIEANRPTSLRQRIVYRLRPGDAPKRLDGAAGWDAPPDIDAAVERIAEGVQAVLRDMGQDLSVTASIVLVGKGPKLSPTFASLLTLRFAIPGGTYPCWGALLACEILDWAMPNGKPENTKSLPGYRLFRNSAGELCLRRF